MVPSLTCQRSAFVLPDDVCYINCSYISPLLKSVEEAAVSGVYRRREPWAITPTDFFEPAERARTLFAELVNGDADGVALIPSVSYGVGLATANLPVKKDQSVVILKEQFPSNVYPWEVLCREKQAQLRRVPYPSDDNLTEAVLECINDSTAVVAIPQIHWITGAKINLSRVRQKTARVGSALVVDASQSLGPSSFDIARIKPDFLINTGYKGLLGPYGLCFAHIAREYRSGIPLEQGWLNRLNSDNFASLTNYQAEYWHGARRYDMGERANPIHLGMAIAAFEQLLEWGMERIAAYNRNLIDYILNKADQYGFSHTSVKHCSDNMLGVTLPPSVSPNLADVLNKEKVYIAVRGDRIRLAPHVYNNREEIDRLFQVLSKHI